MKCEDCYWYSDVTVKCCERDGSEPCNPKANACDAFEAKDQIETDSQKHS